MNENHEITVRISPECGRITVEECDGPVVSRKEISKGDLLRCFQGSLRTDTPGYGSGFLPLNTLAVWQDGHEKRLTLWYPRLYADLSLYETPYPHFPLPRLVFSFHLDDEGKVSGSRIGVVADEAPSPDTVMYHYPFSNVSEDTGSLCVGSNTMPIYKKLHKAVNLPAFLLSIPNNMDRYYSTHNKLGLDYRALMEHLKDKEPAYYYSDILIPNGKTLGNFINNM
jgi:hypothetical protein